MHSSFRRALSSLSSSRVVTTSIAALTCSLAPAAALADVPDELANIPGMTVLEEQPVPAPGFRFFLLSYTQPVDHHDPSRGTFEQKLTLLHRSASAPTVAFTSGYEVRTTPFRSEPTVLVDGNQVAIEERFFATSIPVPADFADLDIFQAAADHHRIIQALRPLYPSPWLSTGGSKGGTATVFHRRFFEGDIDGSIVYVAPNDVVDAEDDYAEFLAQVGNAECRERLIAVQRAALQRRDEVVPVMAQVAREAGVTFDLVGSADRAYELTILELFWVFWQYSLEADCALVPDASAPLDELITFIGDFAGLITFADENQLGFVPFYYQAGTQLGYPDMDEVSLPLRDLLRYPGIDAPRQLVPAEIPMSFDPLAMPDIDAWVKEQGHHLLFVYGENDPWSAEPYALGEGTTDSSLYTAPNANHGARIASLSPPEQLEASNTVRAWAGLPPIAPPEPAPSARANASPTTGVEATPFDGLDVADLLATRRRL